MSPTQTEWVLAITIFLPFAFSLALFTFGRETGFRKAITALYAVCVIPLNFALLEAFLGNPGGVGWGSLRLHRVGFPIFLIVNLISAVVMFYGGFKRSERQGVRAILATVPIASGLTGVAVLSTGLVPFTALWEGVTVVALVGLIAHGSGGLRKRINAFLPWLVSDVLFISAVILSAVLLDETVVYIESPLVSGNEAQVVLIMVLFLVSALIRLGVFPFSYWIGDLIGMTDSAWSGFFLGTVNFALAGLRLLVVTVLIARLVVTDWSVTLVLVGVFTIVAALRTAVKADKVPRYISGVYSFQAGFIITGVGLFSRSGLESAYFLLLIAPLALTSAIMAAGTVESIRGSLDLDQRRISARIAPAAFVVLLASGMSLSGVPPVDGFVGRAMLVLANLDKASLNPMFALVSAVLLAGIAIAIVMVLRSLAGLFSGAGEAKARGRPAMLESLAPLALCAASVLIGLFPGIITRNFSAGASRAVFPAGFVGPGVIFRPTSVNVDQAISSYASWSGTVAAFLLLVALIVLVSYFAGRASQPGHGTTTRLEPFVGGQAGDFQASVGGISGRRVRSMSRRLRR